jgi:integrase
MTRRKQEPPPLQYGDGSITLRKDGLYVVRVYRDGKRQAIGSSKDEQKARKILDDYRADVAAGLNPAARDWLLADWLAHCLSLRTPRYHPNGTRARGVEVLTFEKYEGQIRNHILPYIGAYLAPRLKDVNKPQVERWFAALCDTRLGADVLNEALQRLSSAMEAAIDNDLILRNPCRGIERLTLPQRTHPKPSELDLVRLMRAIAGDPLEALVWIAMGAGPRRGEVAALRWDDISIFSDDHAIIRFHRRRNRVTRATQARFGLPSDYEREGLKRERERHTDIGGLVVVMLRQRWQHQLAERDQAGTTWKGLDFDPAHPSGYVFTNPIGLPLDVDRISDFMREIRERAGLDIDRFHALRRVLTTLMNKAGVPDRVTMEMVGHADLDQTHYYQDPMASQKRAAAQAHDAELRALLAQALAETEAV